MARVRLMRDEAKAHGGEGALVFGELDPGFQDETGQVAGAGAPDGHSDKAAGETLLAVACGDRELAKVEMVGCGAEENAGNGRCADGPDLAGFGLGRDVGQAQPVQRAWRVDAALHIGEGFVQQG